MSKHNKLLITVTALIFIFFFLQPGVFDKAQQYAVATRRSILSKQILAQCSGYNMVENRLSCIYYTDADKEYIDLVKAAIDLYYPLLASDFNKPPPKATFIIYPEKEALNKSIQQLGDATPMGAYYGGVINILSPRLLVQDSAEELTSKEIFLEKGPIIHELTHFLLDVKTDGNYDLWFSEGLALYYEYKYTAFEWRNDLKEKSSTITVTQLKNDFRSLDEAMAYRRAFDVVNNISIQNGEDTLQNMIDILSHGG